MTFVRVGGVPHHVRVDGGGPYCVLSPGLGMCWFDWDAVVPLLSPHRTVVRFDRPGLGLSGHARAWPTLDGEARRIAAVLDALGADDAPATVVGHSLAGFHAEAFARLFPDRVSGLVLLDSSVEENPRPRRAPTLRNATTRACGTLLSMAGMPRAVGPLLRRAAVRAGRTGVRADHRAAVRATDGTAGDPAPYDLVRRAYSTSRSLHAILAEFATYTDEAVELAAVRRELPLPAIPVAVLAAVGSPCRLARQRALADRLGGSFHPAAPSGHLVMLDRPQDVARVVLTMDRGQPGKHVRPPLDEGRAQRC